MKRAVAAALWAIAAVTAAAQDMRRSGLDFMTPATQALQRDDTQNPAMLWLADGRQRFETACARCHEAAAMRGVAPRYPAVDAKSGQALSLAGRINLCRARHLLLPPLPREDEGLLALEMFVANASRGMPVTPSPDARIAALRERGAQLWATRFGQLAIACRECHDGAAGARLGGSTIPQGHPTGYPIYRLEWQGIGSLQRRLRGCMTGVRAEPFAPDSPEALALEAFLMQRAAGMPLETPAVRP